MAASMKFTGQEFVQVKVRRGNQVLVFTCTGKPHVSDEQVKYLRHLVKNLDKRATVVRADPVYDIDYTIESLEFDELVANAPALEAIAHCNDRTDIGVMLKHIFGAPTLGPAHTHVFTPTDHYEDEDGID